MERWRTFGEFRTTLLIVLVGYSSSAILILKPQYFLNLSVISVIMSPELHQNNEVYNIRPELTSKLIICCILGCFILFWCLSVSQNFDYDTFNAFKYNNVVCPFLYTDICSLYMTFLYDNTWHLRENVCMHLSVNQQSVLILLEMTNK